MTKKLSIVDSVIGILAFDEDNHVVDKALFPKECETLAEKILKVETGEVIDEVRRVVKKLKDRCDVITLENSKLAENLRRDLGVQVEVEKPSRAGEYLRSNLSSVAVQVGFAKKPETFYKILREVSTIITKLRVRKIAAKKDKIIVQLINAIDELDRTSNLLGERISEWYGLHFPELSKAVESYETYVKLINNLGLRENFNVARLENLGIPSEMSQKIVELAKTSIGAPMEQEDMKSLQSLGELYLEMCRKRRYLSDEVESLMDTVAPNLKTLAGPTLGARLIALGGGLDRLATFPSSTFQVLGAEKALFRALKTGAKPPKHGVIFQHPLVHQSPRWQRGKVSRALAGKIAIAARVDAFRGANASEKLKKDLERRVTEIREKYRFYPQKPKARKTGS